MLMMFSPCFALNIKMNIFTCSMPVTTLKAIYRGENVSNEYVMSISSFELCVYVSGTVCIYGEVKFKKLSYLMEIETSRCILYCLVIL